MTGLNVAEARARAALTVLPSSVEGIADFFRVRDIKGVRSDACDCPVANYLKGAIDDPNVGVVFGSNAVLWDRSYADMRDLYVVAERVVAEFASLFDEGAFPDLIA